MPIEKIVPDAVTDENSVFTFSGASNNLHLALDEDDTNYVNCAGSDVGGSFEVSFGNLTSSIGSINSIRFYVIGFTGGIRGVVSTVTFDLVNVLTLP